MKIILSGGWGYGNLGDEAILISSLKILNTIYSNAQITVLSFNPELSYLNIKNEFPDIKIIESFHSYLFGYERKYYKLNVGLFDKIVHRILRSRYMIFFWNSKIDLMIKLQRYYFKKISVIYESLFTSADIFILSGGGYINDWSTSLISKYLEVLYADRYSLPIFSIGQTIGPFNKESHFNLARKMFLKVKYSVFRDNLSIIDAKKMRIKFSADSIPDVALFDVKSSVKMKQIVIIPFNNEISENMDAICVSLLKLSQSTNCKIIISISQLWDGTLMIAEELYRFLKKRLSNVELVIPFNLSDLEILLNQSELVISQNLHGLILAYRSNTNIVSLNNRRKFQTFMQMVDLESFVISPDQIEEETFIRMYEEYKQIPLSHKNFGTEILSKLIFLKEND